MKKSTIFRAGISFVAMGLLIYFLKDHFKESLHILSSDVVWSWFYIALGLYLGLLVLLSLRLKLVFKAQDISLTFMETFYLTFVGLFFNLFLPSAVGGDVAKIYYAYKHSGKKLASTTSVIFDRLLGFVALMLLALLAMVVMGREISDGKVHTIIYCFLGLMLFTVLFFQSKRFARTFKFLAHLIPSAKWRDKLADLYHAMYGYKNHKLMLITTLVLALMIQCGFIFLHYFLGLSLGFSGSAWVFFLLVPLVTIVSMAPSLGGLGVREAGAVLFFKAIMPTERALALILLMDLIIYGFCFLGGLLYAVKGGTKPQSLEKIASTDNSGDNRAHA